MPQPLGDACDRRRRGTGAARYLLVRHALIDELGNFPALRHRIELRPRAEIPQETLGELYVLQRGDGHNEVIHSGSVVGLVTVGPEIRHFSIVVR